MVDHISREAAIKAAMQDTGFHRSHEFNAGCARAANNLKAIPAADVAPVVRCRECIWHNERGNRDEKDTAKDRDCVAQVIDTGIAMGVRHQQTGIVRTGNGRRNRREEIHQPN